MNKTTEEQRKEIGESIMKLIEQCDPHGYSSDPAYWGNVLRQDLIELLDLNKKE